MTKRGIYLKIFVSLLFYSCLIYAQNTKQQSYALADSLIKVTFGSTYIAGSMLDVDCSLEESNDKSQWSGYIFEDPKHQLRHSLIVAYGNRDSIGSKEMYGSRVSLNDSGGIVIIRNNRIAWCSKRIILDYSDFESCISGFADFNNDGITDIIYSHRMGYQLEGEELWLITPNSQGGKLLNDVDDFGCSTIVGCSNTFIFNHIGNNNTIVIRAGDVGSEYGSNVFYIWNGNKYVIKK
jgi:hypothetical protein